MAFRFQLDAGSVVRGIIGVVVGAIGIVPFALLFASGEPQPVTAPLLGATMLLTGLMLLAGAIAGVDENGKTPETAPRWLASLVEVLGTLAFIGFAATFTSIALLPELGPDALFLRLGFGAFSLLLWAGVIGGLLFQLRRGLLADQETMFAAIPRGALIVMAVMTLIALALIALLFTFVALGMTSTPVRLSLPIPAEWLGGAGEVMGRLMFAAGAALWWFAFAVLARGAWTWARKAR